MYNRIKELREDNDISQKEVSKILGIDQSNYSKIELGKLALKDEILIKLAIYYSTSIDYLLGITNQKMPYPRAKLDIKK